MDTNREPGADKRERFGSYSPQRRTALVLSGTGAHGAYQAGVLRALQEAGVKIDLLAGHGVGAASAALTAIDGASRLWEPNGVWQNERAARLYGWKSSARILGWLCAALLAVLVAAVLPPLFGITLPLGAAAVLIVLVVGAAGTVAALVQRSGSTLRRAGGEWWWRIVGAPVDAEAARALFINQVWELIRGAAPIPQPSRSALGRRFSEVLVENAGQPGFPELVIVATDLDTRRDVVAALLAEPYRTEFLAPRPGRDRRSEVLDLTGVERDHALDLVAAALTPPVVCDPELVTFAANSFWRGETHRMCDRPGAVNRLLEEVAAAGATQIIVVSAIAPVTGPHQLRVPRLDLRSRLGDFQVAAEAAALRDALEMARLRFDSVYVIGPAHNAVGPFDVGGAYDEASDRRQELQELMERAYEDAYRQFIEPVVGASGEQLARAQAGAAGRQHADRLFDDADSAALRDLN
jgi:hypothetical protein